MDVVAEEDDALLEVKFYQGDEDIPGVLENTGQIKETDNGGAQSPTRKLSGNYKVSKLWTSKPASFSKSTESEDSGVKSVSSNDDPSSRRIRFSFQRQTTISSMNSSPLFDFPSFDELFHNQGEFSLSLHPSPVKKVSSGMSIKDLPVQRDLSITESDKGFDEIVDIAAPTEENEEKERPSLTRRDSVMILSFSEMIYRSWEGSKGFVGFRHKLGNNLRHKYCMMCRLHSTIFIFLYILFGIFLTSAGVLCWIQCHGEILVSLYLICDGVLSVFFFPIILMDWTKKIGGCVSEKNKNGTGAFWPVTLCTLFITVIVGTIITIYRYHLQNMPWENQVCEIEYYVILSAVITEWTFLTVVIVIPLVIYGFVYFIAPSLL